MRIDLRLQRLVFRAVYHQLRLVLPRDQPFDAVEHLIEGPSKLSDLVLRQICHAELRLSALDAHHRLRHFFKLPCQTARNRIRKQNRRCAHRDPDHKQIPRQRPLVFLKQALRHQRIASDIVFILLHTEEYLIFTLRYRLFLC